MKTILGACIALFLLLYSLPLRVDVVPPYEPPPPIKLDPTSAQCIATALWHEARGETLDGQRAVLDVILHRQQSDSIAPTFEERIGSGAHPSKNCVG